jgi:hypothetical protein
MDELHLEMKQCLITMDGLITQIKQAAKKDELQTMNLQIDAFNPEGIVTKYELKKILE